MFDMNDFIRNSSKYTSEHYGVLAGKHVAWSFDGNTALAIAPTLADLYAAMTVAGREDFVTDYIDPLPVIIPSVPLSRAS